MSRRVGVIATVLLAIGMASMATPASAHHSSGRGGDALHIAGITWGVDDQRFHVTHRMSRESAERAVLAGWVIRTKVVVDDVRSVGPVDAPVRIDRDGDGDSPAPTVAVDVAVPWDRDDGTAHGPWYATVTSELVNRGGRTVGSPVELVSVVTEDETVLGHLSTESDGEAGHTPHTGSDSFKAGPGCSVQCITSGVAYAVGVGAHLRVTTDTPAQITIGIHGVGEFSSPSDQTKAWGKTFPDLQPDTTYLGYAFAEDQDGQVSSGSGELTTLRRFARVEFDGFEIASHPGGHDDGFTFLFDADGAWAPGLQEFHHEPELPATLPGVRTIEVADAPSTLAVAVRVVALDDDDAPCESVEYETLAEWGDDGCIAWGTGRAGVGVVLDTYPDDATEWTGHTLSTSASTVDHPVHFDAPFDIEVWYA